MESSLTYTPLKIEVTVSSPAQLTDLIELCRAHEIHYKMLDAAVFAPGLFDDTLKTPTPAFKELCGPEWLTPKGKISVSGAFQFLRNYVRVHGLLDENGVVTMTTLLLSVFGAQHPKLIHQTDLLRLAESVLN
jgi:hypothetical protein